MNQILQLKMNNVLSYPFNYRHILIYLKYEMKYSLKIKIDF